jgi:hypothetical protein
MVGTFQTKQTGSPPPLTIYQQPATPNMGNLTGANTIIATPPFGNRVVRCTDTNTSTLGTYHSYELTDSGNGFDQQWNSDGTILSVIIMATGGGTFMGFNRSTMQCTSLYPSFSMGNGRSWSRTLPHILRSFDNPGGNTLLDQWVINPPTAPTKTDPGYPPFDFNSTNCVGMYSPGTATTWTSLSGTTMSDVVVAGFSNTGGQDTGNFVAAWDPTTGGCQVYNTQTGAITSTGGYGVTGTATTNYAFKLHATVVWPSGWVELEVATGSCPTCPGAPMFWQVGTLNTTMASGGNGGGHTAGGYTNWFNLPNAPQIAKRPFTAPGSGGTVITGNPGAFPGPQNTHMTYIGADPGETRPIIESQSMQPSPVAYGAPLTVPLQTQLFEVYPTTGYFLPITFNFNSGQNNNFTTNFRTAQTVPSEDPLGGFVAFPSDWMGTLGNTDGVTTTCVTGGWPWNHMTSTFVFPVGYRIEPNTSPSNAGKYVFNATVSGTRGTTEPVWPQTIAGPTDTCASLPASCVVDGGVTWQNIGPPNCRNDVFIAQLP